MMNLRTSFLLLCSLLIAVPATTAQALKSDTINVIHYNLSLDLKHLSHQQIYGAADLTITPALTSVSSFSLDFRKLTIDSVFLNGTPHNQYQYNDSVLHILLSTPQTSSDTFVLRVVYHGIPLIEPYNWGGFHFLTDSTLAYNLGVAFEDYPHNYGRVWFPCLDDFIDRATYDLHVRTKGTHQAIAGGLCTDTTYHSDGTITWHWQLGQPIPTYLASVAVGDLVTLGGTYHGIQDTIPTYVYVRPADSLKAVASFANLNAMMAIFENQFGPYRWSKVGYTGTTKGAMEHATNIAMPRNHITGNLTYDWLIAHELSHHWFGNLVTCGSAEDMWINEGWARYCEAVYTEGMHGWESYKSYIMDLQKEVLNYAHTNASGGDGAWFPLYPVPQTHTYGTTVYDKGALVAHTLRHYVGDSLFFPAIRALLDHFAFQPMSSYQMRDFLSQETGINLTPFFDGWVFTPGFPHFSIDSTTSSPYNGGWNVTLHVRQKMVGRTSYTNNNRPEIGFYNAVGHYDSRTLAFSGATGSQTFWLPFDPILVLMDPEDRMADASTTAKQLIVSGATYNYPNTFFKLKVNAITDTMLFHVEHAFVPPDPMPQPVQGLTISPNRYWKISGHFPPGTHAEGLFSFSLSNQYDNQLLTNSADSLVILYREGAGKVWHGIPFTRTPSPFAGTLTVPNLLPGEYVLAVWDEDHIGIGSTINDPGNGILLYPNPAMNQLRVQGIGDKPLSIRISNLTGAEVFSTPLTPADGGDCNISMGHLSAGVYLVEVYNDHKETIHSQKISIIR